MSQKHEEVDEPLSAIGESALAAGLVIEDETPELDPATFDLDSFALGIRPTRRTVTLHLRSDLIATLDEIVAQIDDQPEDADVDDLIDAYEATKAKYHAAVARWTVEARSSEWVSKRWADYAKPRKINLDSDGEPATLAERRELVIDQLVGQVVTVKTLDGRDLGAPTHEQLEALYEANEVEFNKLIYAVRDANTAMSSSAKVLTLDFSSRRSTSRSGAAS